ncbi:hypothetical protein RI367_003853 [Sorochytrium milnesiophthora]
MVLLAETEEDAQLLLLVAERHARDLRYTFNINKCEHLVTAGADVPPLLLEHQPVPQCTLVKYLVIPLTTSVIAADEHLSRHDRQTGAVCIKIIKAFLRTLIEWLVASQAARMAERDELYMAHFVWQDYIDRCAAQSRLGLVLRAATGWRAVVNAIDPPARPAFNEEWTLDAWTAANNIDNKPIQHSWRVPARARPSLLLTEGRAPAALQSIVIRWRLGQYTGDPKDCTVCGQPDVKATRMHLHECRDWQARFPPAEPLRTRETAIDALLNQYERTGTLAPLLAAGNELRAIALLLNPRPNQPNNAVAQFFQDIVEHYRHAPERLFLGRLSYINSQRYFMAGPFYGTNYVQNFTRYSNAEDVDFSDNVRTSDARAIDL